MNGFSFRIVPRLPGRRALIAVLLIGMVLLGTVAVHSMMTLSAAASATATVSNSGSGALDGPVTALADGVTARAMSTMGAASVYPTAESTTAGAPLPGAACTNSCGTGWLMLGIMCAVMILAVVLAMLLIRPAFHRATIDLLRRVAAFVAARLAPLRPPSLLVLSISRT